MPVFSSPIRFRNQAAAVTPATGETAMWMDANGTLRTKDPSGVEKALSGNVYDDTGYIDPGVMAGGWGPWNSTSYPVRYRRINGIVYITGLVANGTPGATTVFTLPVGMRPLAGAIFNTRTSGNGNAWVETRSTDGAVLIPAATSTAWVSLEVSFPAADYTPPTALTRAFDQTSVTNGAKVNAAATTAYLRGSEVIVSVNATVNTAMVAGDILFTLPAGYRPPGTIFVELSNASVDPPVAIRHHVNTDGTVTIQGSAAAGILFRGSFTLPVSLSITYGDSALSAYPVGSIYISVVNTSPGSLFGGTWSAFATGRTLVGVDTAQTEFNTVEKTGGAKTHLLTAAESGTTAHNHPATGSTAAETQEHTHSGTTSTESAYHYHAQYPINWYVVGSSSNTGIGGTTLPQTNEGGASATGAQDTLHTHSFTTGGRSATHTHATTVTVNNSTAASASTAHNNLQPFITVYMWKRTA